MAVLSIEALPLQTRSTRSSRGAVSVVVAAGFHAALALLALRVEAPLRTVHPVTEVELIAPAPVAEEPPLPPLPPEVATPEPPAPERAPRLPRTQAAAPRPTPSGPAHAGALRTADEAAPTEGEPVRFAADARGGAYGFGVVSAAGTGSRGESAQAAPVAETHVPIVQAVPGLPKFATAPKLTEADPCRGFFPHKSQVDRGEAEVRVLVEASGEVRSVQVLADTPRGQGFAESARACLLAKRFLPARDDQGGAVAARIPIRVVFSR